MRQPRGGWGPSIEGASGIATVGPIQPRIVASGIPLIQIKRPRAVPGVVLNHEPILFVKGEVSPRPHGDMDGRLRRLNVKRVSIEIELLPNSVSGGRIVAIIRNHRVA